MLLCRMYVLGQPKIEMNCQMVILENVASTTPLPVFCEANRKEMNILFHSEALWFEPEFKKEKCIAEDIRLECT